MILRTSKKNSPDKNNTPKYLSVEIEKHLNENSIESKDLEPNSKLSLGPNSLGSK